MPSLTYAEIAEALKITPESANRLARRKRWPRIKGNDGRTRVAVPEEALVRPDSPSVSPGDGPPDSPPDNPVHAQIARLEGELAGTREALAEARARAGAAEASWVLCQAYEANPVPLATEKRVGPIRYASRAFYAPYTIRPETA